jgi:hypothetical protein
MRTRVFRLGSSSNTLMSEKGALTATNDSDNDDDDDDNDEGNNNIHKNKNHRIGNGYVDVDATTFTGDGPTRRHRPEQRRGGGGGGGNNNGRGMSFILESTRRMKKKALSSSSTTTSKKDGPSDIHQILASWDSFEDEDDDAAAAATANDGTCLVSSPHSGGGTGTIMTNPSFAEQYWHGQGILQSGIGHRDLLAERMFVHLWQTQGKDSALSVLDTVLRGDVLHQTTEDRFERGCQLWGQDKHDEALWELQRVQTMLEVQHGTGLLHKVCRIMTPTAGERRQCNNNENTNNANRSSTGTYEQFDHTNHGPSKRTASNNGTVRPSSSPPALTTSSSSTTSWDDDDDQGPIFTYGSMVTPYDGIVSHTQLYYALGMVYLGLKEPTDALVEFRRALQIAYLRLGDDHQLTRATLYMIRTTLLTIGLSSPKIHHYIDDTLTDLSREAEGDIHLAKGEWDMAVLEYVNVRFLKDVDVQTQGRVRSKMATAFDEKGDHGKALELWSTVMALYSRSDAVGPDHVLTRYVTDQFVDCRARFCRLEI